MNDNRNMILAIVLSAFVLLGWSLLSDKFFPAPTPPAHQVDQGKAAGAGAPVTGTPSTGSGADGPQAVRARDVVLGETPRLRVETPRLAGSINLKGARFDDLVLVRERETIAKDSPPVRLFSPAGAKNSYFAQFGWTGSGVAAPDANSLWTASAPVLKPGQPVTLSWTNPTGQRFEQIISVDDGYLFTVRQRVANTGANAISLQAYGLTSRSEKSHDPDGWTMHVGPMTVLDGVADYEVNYSTLDDNRAGVTKDARSGWLGFTDKYWLTAIAPANGSNFAASLKRTSSGAYQADYLGAKFVVDPGQAVTGETRLFAGAKDYELLQRYDNAGIPELSQSIDWGWFEWFMIPIFKLLLWLFHQIGNFGFAIICLTLIVRLLMFPVANKQFQSMAGMRKVQPKMKALQDRYKDDKPKLQQEMLKLYQEEKINPAAGCLPILLQIPVFYALYKTLMVSVEMRHQPFALWIKDLSAPDPATFINLFGLLDFTPPHFLAIGVLPILVGFTQWLSIKLNPQPMDPTQQQIFAIMPWVLIVVMAPFAAGLHLYWITNNILTVAQQSWLYKRYGLTLHDTHPVESEKS